ncbi:MAG: isoamylase early set domain-containing protein [Elusimicrobia bacterium]|nr:isoamylase early set domain-containing protein [Elusimicrobiota bacterium]
MTNPEIEKKLSILPSYLKKQNAPAYLTSKIIQRLSLLEKPRQTEGFSFFVLRWSLAIAALWIIGISLFFKMDTINKVKVKFVVINRNAETISIVGDFNKWDKNANKLIKNGDKWLLEMNLRPGRYQYMFVVNGSDWVTDQKARETIDDGFGQSNSILDTNSAQTEKI